MPFDPQTIEGTPSCYPPAVSVEAVSAEVRKIATRATIVVCIPSILVLIAMMYVACQIKLLRAEQTARGELFARLLDKR